MPYLTSNDFIIVTVYGPVMRDTADQQDILRDMHYSMSKIVDCRCDYIHLDQCLIGECKRGASTKGVARVSDDQDVKE